MKGSFVLLVISLLLSLLVNLTLLVLTHVFSVLIYLCVFPYVHMPMCLSSACYWPNKILLTCVHMPPSDFICTAVMATDSSFKVIDGKSVAKQIRDEITAEVSRMRESIGVIPGLAVILVGDRKDSATYVRNKKKACESVGINSLEANLPEDSTEEEVLNYIAGYNDDPSVHGILVQLPLPSVYL